MFIKNKHIFVYTSIYTYLCNIKFKKVEIMTNLMERLKKEYAEKIFSEYNKEKYPNTISDLEESLLSNVSIIELNLGEALNMICFLSNTSDGTKSLISMQFKAFDIYNLFDDGTK